MIKTCVYPIAGYGTRFLPFTKEVPKEMLPIGAKPLIHYGVEEAFNSGIKRNCMITSDAKLSIQKYFSEDDNDPRKEYFSRNNHIVSLTNIIQNSEFSFINQISMKGLGDAILHAKEIVKEKQFAVILVDDFCFNYRKSVISQLIDIAKMYPDHCVVAVEEVEEESIHNYGIVEIGGPTENENLFRVKSLVEKPKAIDAPSNLAIIGRYILSNEIFMHIENIPRYDKSEIQITTALNSLAKLDKVLALRFDGLRFDCGSFPGFLSANIFINKES